MKYAGQLPLKGAAMYWSAGTVHRDILGRICMMNLVRPITRWRRLRTWLCFAERDTMVARNGNPRLEGSRLIFDGDATMSCRAKMNEWQSLVRSDT